MGWIKLLCTKNQAILAATKEFIKYIQNQHSTSIKGWIKAFKQLMHYQGSHVYISTTEQMCWAIYSHPNEQSTKMHFHACLFNCYWKFAVQHVVHVYNCTSKWGLNWRIPHELLIKTPPTVSHLCVFGCTAYVHLPVDICSHKLQSKLQLIIYISGHNAREWMQLSIHVSQECTTYIPACMPFLMRTYFLDALELGLTSQ